MGQGSWWSAEGGEIGPAVLESNLMTAQGGALRKQTQMERSMRGAHLGLLVGSALGRKEAGVAGGELGWGMWERPLKTEWPSRAVPTSGEVIGT